jgi:hypothetical protein
LQDEVDEDKRRGRGTPDPLVFGRGAVVGELLRDDLRESDAEEHACATHSEKVSDDDIRIVGECRK